MCDAPWSVDFHDQSVVNEPNAPKKKFANVYLT